jgi:hypothetical protein
MYKVWPKPHTKAEQRRIDAENETADEIFDAAITDDE